MADAAEMRRALLISSSLLAALAKRFNLNEATTAAVMRLDGVDTQFTLGEALDIADRALEPPTTPPDRDSQEPPHASP